MTFEEFCGGSLWNESLLIYNSWPEFTQCFRDTVLVWVPSGFLWLTSPLYLPYLISSTPQTRNSISGLNISKTVTSCLLVIFSIVIAVSQWSADRITWAHKSGFLIKAATYLLTILLMQIDRRHGVISSGLLFVYWTVEMVTSLVPFYTSIMLKMYEDSVLEFTVITTSFVFIVISFVLQWFPEIPPHRDGIALFEERQCPEVTASFPSKLLIWWMMGLIIHGYRKGIQEGEMWTLNPRDTSHTLVPIFEQEWKKGRPKSKKSSVKVLYNNDGVLNEADERTCLLHSADRNNEDITDHNKLHPSLLRILWRLFRGNILLISLIRVLADLLILVSPLIMSALITYITNKTNGEEWKGYTLAAALLGVQVIANILNQYTTSNATVLGMQMNTICIAAVYKKALTISNEARKTTTTGEIVNLMSVDCQRINEVMENLFSVISAPIQIVLTAVLIYNTIGWSMFAGLTLILLLIPFNSYLGTWQRKLQMRNLRFKDQRIKLLDEILNGIKILKLYAWETPFMYKARSVRSQEVRVLLHLNYINLIGGLSLTLAPFLVVLATFAAYILVDPSRHLDANTAFVTLALYNTLRMPMLGFPTMIVRSVQAYVSIQRINRFLCREDISPDNVQRDITSAYAVTMENGQFTWDKTVTPVLRGTKVRKGKFSATMETDMETS